MRFRPVILIIAIIILLSFFTSSISGPFKYLSYPYDLLSLVSSRIWQNVTDIYQTVTWKKKRIESLEAEMNRLAERLIEYENIKRENILLKELLGLKETQKNIVTFARVVRRGLSRWSSAVVIDKGEKDGVRKDMSVVTSRGLVGKVIAVNRDFSEVLLLDDSNFRVAVRFMSSRTEGIASGTGKGVIVRYVPKETEVIKNDWVITSGLDGIFPGGLLIGYVTDIKEQGFFNEVSIKTSQNLRGLEFVGVVSR